MMNTQHKQRIDELCSVSNGDGDQFDINQKKGDNSCVYEVCPLWC